MMWIFAILIVLVLGLIGLVAAGRGEPMEETFDDRPDVFVPADRLLGADDLRRVRFSLAVRGYRMAEVDELLKRVASQLEDFAGDEPDPVPLALPPAEAEGAAPGDPGDSGHPAAG